MRRVIAERSLSETAVNEESALGLYRELVRVRRFDERALSLQRRGGMSSYPSYRGQGASQVGAASALTAEDWLFPTYRSNALQIARGVPMSDVLLFRRGHPEFSSDHNLPVFPQAVPIATQLPHAVGAGMAAAYRGADHAVLAYLGDGATSEGDFHEAMNFAGVFDAPVVFFCENNGWAISTPRERQTASATLAQKARAYGFEGVRVDGMDPIAVRRTVADALGDAREGTPVFVESLTNRQGAHTTSDDPSRYRHRGPELPDWRTADPLERFETYLREAGVLDDELIATVEAETERELDRAVERAEAVPDPDPEELFEPVFAEVTAPLAEQRRQLRSREIDDR
ncbi:pyruvate dehydrogenase (acetyl-transferring) E1 component subunit alpha [Halobacteriales archaeon QH_10_67_13]|nr:MAG: pyruvate dehydrogenase (acetyl-transferring) E1 component subunit alpha [Halobacteriales archaeon QH_10_67_13]